MSVSRGLSRFLGLTGSLACVFQCISMRAPVFQDHLDGNYRWLMVHYSRYDVSGLVGDNSRRTHQLIRKNIWPYTMSYS